MPAVKKLTYSYCLPVFLIIFFFAKPVSTAASFPDLHKQTYGVKINTVSILPDLEDTDDVKHKVPVNVVTFNSTSATNNGTAFYFSNEHFIPLKPLLYKDLTKQAFLQIFRI